MNGLEFTFVDTEWNDDRTLLTCRYLIETDERNFDLSETLLFSAPIPDSKPSQCLVQAIHLALGISYYKAFVPPKITHPYRMDESQAAFWNTVYLHGLGEFLYKNKLPANRIAQFSSQSGAVATSEDKIDWQASVILGLGGGKDSILAGEILKEIGIQPTGFVLATGEILGQTRDVANVMGINLLPIKRQIDLQIIEINSLEGAYNGHIPISLIFALIGCLLATAQKSKYVIIANEASASIPHVQWADQSVNHQWSKSLEFERLFQNYIHENVDPELSYFSAIRPLTSLGVAKLFSSYPDYFGAFTSDNSVFRIKQGVRDHPRWSHDSPKSLSSFMLLAPHMSDDDLQRTFGRNFLDDSDLEELFISLLGRSNTPILDCVGTPEELLYSLQQLYVQERFITAALMKKAIAEGLVNNQKSTVEAVYLDAEHAFPPELKSTLFDKLKEKLS